MCNAMGFRFKAFSVAALLGVSAQVYAAATCTTVGSSGSTGFKIAVASNFYEPAQSLAEDYANTKGIKVEVCHDSSGNLYTQTGADNSPQYAIFFSADTNRPQQFVDERGDIVEGSPATYAKGIPVFVLAPSVLSGSSESYPALSYMRTGLSSGATAESSSSSLTLANKVVIRRSGSRTVTALAIGDPDLAPYGVAARQILGGDASVENNMGLWAEENVAQAGSDVSSSCSSKFTDGSGEWICTYNNIDNTLRAIDGDKVTAGIVSYAQICDVWAGTNAYPAKQYVKFPDYPTTQDYIELKVDSSSARTYADEFLAGLGLGSSSWNSWLTSNCYQSL